MKTVENAEHHTHDWESAAQEAAFNGMCFCMISDGRFVNRYAMPDHVPHRNRFTLSDLLLQQLYRLENALK